MYTVKLFAEAESEIIVACKWYESKGNGLSGKFLTEVDHYLNLIATNPLIFPIRFSGKYRFAVFKKFPYFIVFSILEESNTIYVNSVFHTSRDPINF